jgi:hypothetical protein
METKRKNPYVMLLDEIKEHCRKIRFRHTKAMFWYRKEALATGFRLDDLYQRVQAAEQLGYDVVLKAEDDGLHVQYVKKVPQTPYSWE